MALKFTVKSGIGLKSSDAPLVAPQMPITFEVEHRSGVFVPDSAYFWTDEWQEGEREADEDIRAGRVTRFDDPEEGLEYLRNLR